MGEIEVSGSKNGLLPILAATLLTTEPCRIENMPLIQDGKNAIAILAGLGAKTDFPEEKIITVQTANLDSFAPPPELVRKFRGSILFAGALLGRCQKAIMPPPGGDIIGNRPLNAHFAVFRALGAKIEETTDHFLKIEASKLKGTKITLPEISVTATENALLASVLAEGETLIKLAATEPHIQDLAAFLNKLGARIEGAGTNIIRVKGVKKLNGGRHRLIPDSDEALNLAALAAATRSEILIKNIEPDFLDAGLEQLKAMAVNLEIGANSLKIKKPAAIYRAAKIQSGFYPKLLSDQVPPLAVLATQASGVSLIHEWMYEGRLGYINELVKMGANAVLLDPHRALIIGPTPLRGGEVKSLDVRAGMTLLIAALTAEGESTLNEIEHLDRGFENIEGRLRKLGANIVRKENRD